MNLVSEQRGWGYFCSSSSRQRVGREGYEEEEMEECFTEFTEE